MKTIEIRNAWGATVTGALALAATLAGSPALAQEAPVEAVTEDVEAAVKDKAEAPPEEEAKEAGPWAATLTLGASGNALHSLQWIGQDDGFTFSAGGVLGGSLIGRFGDHEWRNQLGYELSLLKTPSIDNVLKSADNLDLKTLYLYRVPALPMLGPFARARLLGPVFPGYAVLAQDRRVSRTDVDGNATFRSYAAQDVVELTGWFEPLTISESVGAFVEPLAEEWLKLDIKGGVGAQHLLAWGGYVVADDDATTELEIKQLQMVHSAGVELEAGASGTLIGALGYSALASLYYPLLVSVEHELELLELTHVELEGKLSYKLTEWFGVDYVLKVRRQPFILNDWQVQNSLLLTAGFNLF
jgi:hypothetical protein